MRRSNGMILGVCYSISEKFDIPVTLLRTFAVIAFLATGFFPVVVIYLLLSFIF